MICCEVKILVNYKAQVQLVSNCTVAAGWLKLEVLLSVCGGPIFIGMFMTDLEEEVEINILFKSENYTKQRFNRCANTGHQEAHEIQQGQTQSCMWDRLIPGWGLVG